MVTHSLTDSLTHMQHTDPVQYTVLGWVKSYVSVYSIDVELSKDLNFQPL